MRNTILNRFFTSLLIATIFLCSCSSDDDNSNEDSDNNVFVELPESDLGVYEGILFSDTISNGDTFVTLSESGDRAYTINFNDDIPSITNIQFVAAPDSVPNNVFTTVEEDLNNRGIAVNLIDNDEGNRMLTVTSEIEGSTIVFTGQIQE